MSQPGYLNKSKRTHKTFRISVTKIINEITEQLTGNTFEKDEIKDLKFLLIENAGQVFKLYSEIKKVRGNCKFKHINL